MGLPGGPVKDGLHGVDQLNRLAEWIAAIRAGYGISALVSDEDLTLDPFSAGSVYMVAVTADRAITIPDAPDAPDSLLYVRASVTGGFKVTLATESGDGIDYLGAAVDFTRDQEWLLLRSLYINDVSPPSHRWVVELDGLRHIVSLTSSDSPYAVGVSDRLIICDTSGGDIECDLPLVSDTVLTTPHSVTFKKVHASNSMIVDPNAGESIDDGAAGTPVSETSINAVVQLLPDEDDLSRWLRLI